jgi:hypothetical protein
MTLLEQGKQIADDIKLVQVLIYVVIIEVIIVIINYIDREKNMIDIYNYAYDNNYDTVILIHSSDDYTRLQDEYVKNPLKLYVYDRLLESLSETDYINALANIKKYDNVTYILERFPTFGALLNPLYKSMNIRTRYIQGNDSENLTVYNYDNSRYTILIGIYIVLYFYSNSEYSLFPKKLDVLISSIEKFFEIKSDKSAPVLTQNQIPNITLSDTTMTSDNLDNFNR